MKTHHKDGEWAGVGLAARAWATWLHLHHQTWIWKICHPWSTLSFDLHPELSIKIIQRMHFITELGAISRPLSFYLYQWRCFQGEHLDLRRPSMKWNAVSSLLCLLSRKVWGYFYSMHSKERLSQRTTIWSEIWIQILWAGAFKCGRWVEDHSKFYWPWSSSSLLLSLLLQHVRMSPVNVFICCWNPKAL